MAAHFYSQTMAQIDQFGHNVGPYVTNPNAGRGASENVLVEMWMNAQEHRAYILSPEHLFIGPGTHLGGRFGVFHHLFLSNQRSVG